jgi:hypothetical protein
MARGNDSPGAVSAFFSHGAIGKAALAAALFVLSLPAGAQTPQSCPAGGPLTLDQVLAAVKASYMGVGQPSGPVLNRDRLAAVVTTIAHCHVRFAMDFPTLDKLAGEKLPVPALDAINRETSAGYSIDDAHREAAAIEAYLRGGGSGAAPAWQPVRAKIDADFEAKSAALQKDIEAPKGEFETQAAATGRVNYAKGQLGPLAKNYDREIAVYYQPFASRIRILGAKTYPITAESVWESYDADAASLKVQINGQEYVFTGVAPQLARSYKERWPSVQAGEKYDDDGTRFLFFSVTGPRLLGQLPRKVEEERAAGVWVDAETGMMWPLQSSSSPFRSPQAAVYCSTLPQAGYADWRLPTIDELETLRADPLSGGVRGGITLAPQVAGVVQSVWSGTWPLLRGDELFVPVMNYGGYQATVAGVPLYDRAAPYGDLAFGIPSGARIRTNPGLLMPALCVRNTDAGPAPPAPPVRFLEPPAMLAQAQADFDGKKYEDAFPLADGACSDGRKDGCALEGYLYAFGLGRPADPARGVELLTRACNDGSLRGCDLLGETYLKGGPVPADGKLAFEAFVKACNLEPNAYGGVGEGCVHAAECLRTGAGIRRDERKAEAILDRSCVVGLDEFALACHNGNAEACVNLGRCYERGNYLNRDPDTARMFYQRACSLGEQGACAEAGGGAEH